MAYCSYQERCQSEVADKLREWSMNETQCDQVLAELIEQGFLNEERFARAYARGKFRMKQWGRRKIVQELKRKKVSEYCIKTGLMEIDEAEYNLALFELYQKKSRMVKDKNHFVRDSKIARYLINKGYESNLVWDLVRIKKPLR